LEKALSGFWGAALLVFWVVLPARGANDLLLTASEKTSRAHQSILMDVTHVNGRLVAVGERGHIIYSDDGGGRWIQAKVPVSVTLTAVSFPTDRKGWAVGHDGVVLHSEDSGETWIKQLDGTKINNLMLVELKQVIQDKKRLLEDGANQLDDADREDLILELENFDFFLSDLESIGQEGPIQPLMDVWFKNEREGLAIGVFGILIRTVDGGKNWRPLLGRIKNSDGLNYYSITRSGGDLYIAGESGMLFRSQDWGKNWQALASPYDGSFFGIIGNPRGDLITAFGLRGTIYASRDRGETWATVDSGKKTSISGGAFLSDGSFCVTSVDGAMLQGRGNGQPLTAAPDMFPGSIALTEIESGVLAVVGLKGATCIDLNKSSVNN
jgi:photosystem II stability/assembly factor-like uncharacterized protein